jgi:hypothetical protein
LGNANAIPDGLCVRVKRERGEEYGRGGAKREIEREREMGKY